MDFVQNILPAITLLILSIVGFFLAYVGANRN